MASAQQVDFLERNDTVQKPKSEQFIYIDEKTDLSNTIFVAKIKCTGKIDDIPALFLAIKSEAQKIGSNSFKFESFNRDTGELIVSVYYAEGDFFEHNFKNLPHNKIFIFGHQNLSDSKIQSYKVDGKKFEIASGKYQEFEKNPDREIKINKGGITGMTFWISQSEQGYSSFLSFSGIGLGGVGFGVPAAVGISINTGSINKIEPNMALTLLRIYERN